MKNLVLATVISAITAPAAFADYRDVSAAANMLDYVRTSPYAAQENLNENDFEFMMVFENEAGDKLYAPSSRKGAVKFKPTLSEKGYGDFRLARNGRDIRKWDTLHNVWDAAYLAGYTFVEVVDRPNK